MLIPVISTALLFQHWTNDSRRGELPVLLPLELNVEAIAAIWKDACFCRSMKRVRILPLLSLRILFVFNYGK